MHWQEKLEKSAGEMGKKLRGAWKPTGETVSRRKSPTAESRVVVESRED